MLYTGPTVFVLVNPQFLAQNSASRCVQPVEALNNVIAPVTLEVIQ